MFTHCIYGAGTVLADSTLIETCLGIIDQCEARLQGGSVLTTLTTELRDQVDLIVAGFGDAI